MSVISISLFFFFNDTASTDIYTLSLHDALPITAFASQLPPGPVCGGTTIHVAGRPLDTAGERVCTSAASQDFLQTMGIPLRAGRFVNPSDVPVDDADGHDLPVAVVVNEAAARALWPNRDPIGQLGMLSGANGQPFQVVGVAADVRNNGLNNRVEPAVYLSTAAAGAGNVVVRSELPADQLIAGVRRAIRQIAPTLVMGDVRTMNEVILDTLQLERLSSLVMTF